MTSDSVIDPTGAPVEYRLYFVRHGAPDSEAWFDDLDDVMSAAEYAADENLSFPFAITIAGELHSLREPPDYEWRPPEARPPDVVAQARRLMRRADARR